jgi:hypothetical protein
METPFLLRHDGMAPPAHVMCGARVLHWQSPKPMDHESVLIERVGTVDIDMTAIIQGPRAF